MVRVFLIAATAAVALAAPKKKVTPVACPQVRCANPAPCSYVPSALLNADGCPKHPCGIRTCKTTTAAPASSCCDPTNPAHISHTTTCSVEKQSCADWVASIAAGQVHYKGANGFKKVLDLAHRACKESGDKPHYWVKVKHANPNAWERKSDNFKCARAGSAATPTAAAHCVCCECKDGNPHLAAATAAPTEAAKPTAAPVDANTIITTTKLSTPFKVKGLTVATFSEAAQAGVIAAVAKSAGVHRSQVTLANIKDAQARRLGGVSWESSTSRAVASDIIIAVTDEASKGQAVQLLQDITVGGKAPEVAFAKLVVADMTAAVLADKGTPPTVVAAVQARPPPSCSPAKPSRRSRRSRPAASSRRPPARSRRAPRARRSTSPPPGPARWPARRRPRRSTRRAAASRPSRSRTSGSTPSAPRRSRTPRSAVERGAARLAERARARRDDRWPQARQQGTRIRRVPECGVQTPHS